MLAAAPAPALSATLRAAVQGASCFCGGCSKSYGRVGPPLQWQVPACVLLCLALSTVGWGRQAAPTMCTLQQQHVDCVSQ
jgi:hypothetical protein